VSWETVAEPAGKFESEVIPGFYRLALTYLAPADDHEDAEARKDVEEEGESVLICLYISAPFELTQSFVLLEFEGGH
jgi:hypothetical protein